MVVLTPAKLKSKKWLLILLLPLAAFVVFVVLNIADYRRYCYIMELDKHLTAADFEAMEQAVALGDETTSKEYIGAEIPDVFKKIAAQSVMIYKYRQPNGGGYSVNVRLYERGKTDDKWLGFYTYATLYMEITKQNGKICVADNFKGRSKYRTIWARNLAYEAARNPKNRKISIYKYDLHSISNAWLILDDSTIVHISNASSNSDIAPEIVPITAFQASALDDAIAEISKIARGKAYTDPDVMDGAQMEIRFSSDGEKSDDDMFFGNAWCDEVDSVITLLREYAPKGEAIPSKKDFLLKYRIERRNNELPPDWPRKIYTEPDYKIQSIDEYRACPPLETDWWIVWPKLFLEKPAVVLEVPEEYKRQ